MTDHNFYKKLLDEMHDGVYFVDRERRISYWNHGAERISGYSRDEIVGRFCWNNILSHVGGSGCQLCLDGCPLAQTIIDGQERQAEVYLHHKDGSRIPILVRVAPIYEQDQIVGAVEIFSDNSAQKAAMQQIKHLEALSSLDPLTRLGNRRHIESALHTCIGEFRRYGWTFGLMFTDVDRFKALNDTYGHLVGDDVLKMVASTLAHNIRTFDDIGRWGGEEFVILVKNIDEFTLHDTSERLRKLVALSSLSIEDQPLKVTISIGATLVQKHDDIKSIVDRADRMLYQSKNNGRNRTTLYEHSVE